MIYEELLVASEPILLNGLLGVNNASPFSPQISTHAAPQLSLSILFVNRAIHNEASSILYSRNCFRPARNAFFQLPEVGNSRQTLNRRFKGHGQILLTFLILIGIQNARFLRRICIPFPQFEDCRVGNITLEANGRRLLNCIQRACPNLTTLELSVHKSSPLHTIRDKRLLAEAMAEVDARFKAMPSLINVFVYTDSSIVRLSATFMTALLSIQWKPEFKRLEERDGKPNGSDLCALHDSDSESEDNISEEELTEDEPAEEAPTEDGATEDDAADDSSEHGSTDGNSAEGGHVPDDTSDTLSLCTSSTFELFDEIQSAVHRRSQRHEHETADESAGDSEYKADDES
jgi:hypothetical protein